MSTQLESVWRETKMNRIHKALINGRKKAFVPYIMAGNDGLENLGKKLLFLQECGADAIEIGIPFSDPVADGPTIQRAGIRALEKRVTLRKVLAELKTIKDISIPLIIMTYVNPILSYGVDLFAEDASKAGVSGCIVPDLPIEEEELILPALNEHKLSLIRLVTLTTPTERIEEIASRSTAFIYAVTVTGITGTRKEFGDGLSKFLQAVKSISDVPVLAGFGVSNQGQIEEVCRHCDGVIVGSKVIDLFEKGRLEELKDLIKTTEIVNL
jgi:tryptophan synthase alpha chain